VPSHPFLASVIGTWARDGTIERIQRLKPFFHEKPDLSGDIYGDYKDAIEKSGGAFLIGVFRGRMSEGIDFYDDQSRAVIAFGIPYPPVNDLEIRLKRQYNDEHQGQHMMSGREWYDAQAFRSLFQATGRCIRHVGDYGAVILIDQRFPDHIAMDEAQHSLGRDCLAGGRAAGSLLPGDGEPIPQEASAPPRETTDTRLRSLPNTRDESPEFGQCPMPGTLKTRGIDEVAQLCENRWHHLFEKE
jgi:hypothetical protein